MLKVSQAVKPTAPILLDHFNARVLRDITWHWTTKIAKVMCTKIYKTFQVKFYCTFILQHIPVVSVKHEQHQSILKTLYENETDTFINHYNCGICWPQQLYKITQTNIGMSQFIYCQFGSYYLFSICFCLLEGTRVSN